MGDPARGGAAVAGPFEIRGPLGSGGMGVVYRAHDARLGRDVALKVLRQGSARDLYRFKREFRAIAGLAHPNLIALHELHTGNDEWFFTMELVDGVSFIDRVRPPASPVAGARGRRSVLESELDESRLRAALPQLVDGVLALHVAGKLHRDLKPSNVLVTGDGRVVILDFGLVSDVDRLRDERTHDQAAVGTPSYMSPEQASDGALTDASDWYAVGVMLYEALTGRRPFEGTAERVMHRKLTEVPPAPSALVPGVPPDLDELCTLLLAPDPADRPGGRAILERLGARPSPATVELDRSATGSRFVGRGDELAALRQARADARRGTVTVLVGGESGIGKSRLLRAFLDEHAADAVVLEGRCYEREAVPFRGLDGVIDALTAVLLGLSERELDRLVPRDAAALARLFPVLRRVPVIDALAMTVQLQSSPAELRRRSFDALHAILGRVAADESLIIAIDDLQWGDADSAAFLGELARGDDGPRLLLVLLHRPDDDAGVVAAVRAGADGGDLRALAVGPLSDDEARALVGDLGAGDTSREILVRDGGGHPLFLAELARSSGRRDAPSSLDALIQARIGALAPPAAALLRAVAIAARPVLLDRAARAAATSAPAAELAVLRRERLARVRVDESGTTSIETYHDRIRAAATAAMTEDERRAVHRALAAAYESATATGDLDAAVGHWMAAGDTARAAAGAESAAAVAEAGLAFHRAAELYALALHHGAAAGDERRDLLRRRAEALTSAGRLDEAADAFADAAAGAPPDAALALDIRRLEQILRRGRFVDGRALAEAMLARIGIGLPRTRAGTLRALAVQLIRQRLRGTSFTERAEADVAPDRLRAIDLLFSVATAMGMINPAHGMLVQCHHLRAALDAGEPRRACSALAIELGYLGQRGAPAERRALALSSRVEALADRVGDPYVRGRATTMRGFLCFLLGRWRDAALLTEAGLARMTEDGVGVRWDFDVIEMVHLAALTYLGRARELARLVPLRLREAESRGDVYAPGDLRGGRGNIAWLVAGKPEQARAHLAAVVLPAPTAADYQVRHLDQLVSAVHIDLYEGDAAAAWRRIDERWAVTQASLLLSSVQILRIEAGFLRARAALAAVLAGGDPALLAVVRGHARALAREQAPWAVACALQLRATLAAYAGDRAAATLQLDEAERAYAAADMRLFATAIRLRKGEHDGGSHGESLAAAARDALREDGIADPEAVARLLCPFPSRR